MVGSGLVGLPVAVGEADMFCAHITDLAGRGRRGPLAGLIGVALGATSLAGVPNHVAAGRLEGVVRLTETLADSTPSQADSMAALTVAAGARRAWRTGVTGRGVDVAVIDSGVAQVA